MPEEKPKRMMARKDFKVLRRLIKELKKKRRDYQEWLEDLCDEHAKSDWWPDRMRPNLGFVLVEKGDKKERDRIPRDILLKMRERIRELDDADDKLTDKIVAVALACAVPTTAINPETGEITVEKVEEAKPASDVEFEVDGDGDDPNPSSE